MLQIQFNSQINFSGHVKELKHRAERFFTSRKRAYSWRHFVHITTYKSFFPCLSQDFQNSEFHPLSAILAVNYAKKWLSVIIMQSHRHHRLTSAIVFIVSIFFLSISNRTKFHTRQRTRRSERRIRVKSDLSCETFLVANFTSIRFRNTQILYHCFYVVFMFFSYCNYLN